MTTTTTTLPTFSAIGIHMRVTSHVDQGGRAYMEDMTSVAYSRTADETDLQFLFFGVFDGHGGSHAAAYASKHLLDTIVADRAFWSENDRDVSEAIRRSFVKTHEEMQKNLEDWPKTLSGYPSTSGTTASVAFIMRGKIYTGHVGDSRIILGYQDEVNGEWKAKSLTQDHKPDLLEEKLRIERCGGKVMYKVGVPRVVWSRPRLGHNDLLHCSTTIIDDIPYLAVARSLGDFWSFNSEHNKFVVSPEPDVEVFNIDPSKHRCLIFSTDGIWNVLSADVAVSLVYKAEKQNIETGALIEPDWLNPSKSLIKNAILQYSLNSSECKADNMAVITLIFDYPQTCVKKCQNNNCKCVDGGLQKQKFGEISSKSKSKKNLKTSHALASTSKLYSSTPVATLPIKTDEVLTTSETLNNNSNTIKDYVYKVNGPPTGEETKRKRSMRNMIKKQKLNKNSTNADEVCFEFGNSSFKNEQFPCEPRLISNKSVESEKTKVGVVLKSSGRICKNKKCNNSKLEDSTPPEISILSKTKTPLTEPTTQFLRSPKKKNRSRCIKFRSSLSAGMISKLQKK